MKIFPPPIWAILSLVALYFLSELPVFRGLPAWQSQPLGILFFIAGVLGPVIAITQFRRAGTEVSPTSKTNAKLVTSGIYGFTRNPMYLGAVIGFSGFALALRSPWLLLLLLLMVFALVRLAIVPEEAYLERRFGAAYLDYKRRVRRWI